MNLYNIIKSNDLKLFSPFIEGGTTKLKKEELINVSNIMKNYKKNEKTFHLDDEEINLDDEQYTVVTSKPNQNIRIIAGAGSGKTTTILCRVKYLVDNFTTPNRILILTFNKDSSENLKKRIIKLFDFKINIDIYTIDAFCCLLYHKFHQQKSYISLSEYVLIGRKLMMEYGSEISSKYNYIFFDEFQDVNSKQFDILNEFVKNGCYLTVIGDDAQNIYQFRGTDNYFLINFDNIFNNCSTYTLTTNYRSNQLIVKLANNIINFNENQVKKIMKTHNTIGFRPKFILSDTEDNQNKFIISKISKLIEDGIKLDEIVILSRNSYHLKIMETELTKHNIPLVSCITDKIGDNIKKFLEPNKVTVTTIHKSKGLEWSYVFILGFCNQHFPSHLNNNIKNIEEERRLFYVGVTRAKNRLYLMSTHSEIPISCFIKENVDYIKMVYNPENSKPSFDIFETKDENTIKQKYSVTDIVLLLNTEVIDEMRTNNFIIDFDIECTDLITSLDLDNKIEFSEEIKKGGYEPDFGEFVDRYITRQLIINKNILFKDNDTLIIINEENKDKQNIYPSHFLKILKESYINCQTTKANNLVIKDIYNISLCRNCNNDRRRLIYRNIFNLFNYMLSNGIKNKMDKYIEIMNEHDLICKKIVYHKFKDIGILTGEIDLIDWTEETLIDIKCSESDFKLEWYVQILIYYTLLESKEQDKIKYLGIINIMNGKYYKIKKPELNIKSFIKYIGLMIKRDQNNYRICNNPLKLNSLQYIFEPDNIEKSYIYYIEKDRKYTIILDTETSEFYKDVLQLAYVICDDNGNIIKKVNKYIKNRLPTNDSTKIHGIDINKIKAEGIDFREVINELVNNLSECKYVVGHNLQYDLTTILNDIRSYGINIVDNNNNPILNIFKNIELKDTIQMNGSKIKLEALYEKLFANKFDGAHDALNDVEATKEIYFKLLK
jgi:DNA polymerase III epsilon subunit-like protein